MSNRIFPSFILLLAIGVFFAYVDPMWTESIAEKRSAIAAGEQSLEAAKRYSARQNQLAAARDSIDPANLSALEILLPDSVDNVGLVLDLNALAARSGLAVTNMDVIDTSNTTKNTTNAAAATSPVGSVDLAISATGTFSALQTFLRGIERSARILDVHDLMVAGSDTGVYNYTMKMRLYWLR